MWSKQNLLSDGHFRHMQNIVTNYAFPWFFLGHTATPSKSVEFDQSFSHILYSSEHRSDYFDIFYGTMWGALASIGIEPNEIFRMRLGLIPQTDHNHMHVPHVDFGIPHQTALFCLSGNSGETTFYHELHEDGEESKRAGELTVLGKFLPIENQIILFDGKRYHSSSTPTTDIPRIMLNINYR